MKKLLRSLLISLLLLICMGADQETTIEKVDLNLLKDEVAVTFLDLSSGEAILIQTGLGKTVLINTGGPQTSAELLERIEMYNVTKFDAVILTNLDKQYASNFYWLSKKYHIEQLILPELSKQRWESEFPVQIEDTSYWNVTTKAELIPNMFFQVVDVQQSGGMSLYFSYGNHDVLLMGTADKQMEEKLLEKVALKAEVLKVAEFAKEGGTSQRFLEQLDPHVAIIFQERRKQPSAAVIERLNETWIDIYETRQFGNVTLRCDLNQYEVVPIESDDH